MERHFQEKVAVITGASSGIGRAISIKLAQSGARLVLAARRKEPLETLAEELGREKVLAIPADVARPEEIAKLAKSAAERFGRIDYLFNCAGVFRAGGFGNLDLESIREMMDINYMGTVHCIRAVVPYMQRTRSGHIVTISSLAGKYPIPGSGSYSATKYAVGGLSDALRQELKQDGIILTCVYPSLVSSPLLEGHLESVKASRFYRLTGSYSPEQAAGAILKGVTGRKRELVVPRLTTLTVTLHKLCPGLAEALTGRLLGGWPRYGESRQDRP